MTDVGEVIASVLAREVLPMWRQLSERQIHTKDVGEIVTDADLRAEERLVHDLTRRLPGSVAVGEESLGREPALAERLHGDAPVWVIDPIDGTVNFVAGSPRFACLVALAHRGALIASWTHAPMLGLGASARSGAGAILNGQRVRVDDRREHGARSEVCLSDRQWWSDRTSRCAGRAVKAGMRVTSFDTAGLLYVDLARGRREVAVLDWGYPWDHAAGVLLLREAGGVVQDRTGADVRLTDNLLPMVAASSSSVAARIRAEVLDAG